MHGQHAHSILSRAGSNHAPVVGLVVGVSAALPMYVWQMNVHVAVASFVIFGYTAWLWAVTRGDIACDSSMRVYLRALPLNRPLRRIGRMFIDPGFWWSLLFGCATITGSLWYADLRETNALTAIAGAWAMMALCLNYGITLLYPTTRCRRCGYQLAGHLDPADQGQVLVCPECGAKWSRAQLCLVDVGNAETPKRRSAERRTQHIESTEVPVRS